MATTAAGAVLMSGVWTRQDGLQQLIVVRLAADGSYDLEFAADGLSAEVPNPKPDFPRGGLCTCRVGVR